MSIRQIESIDYNENKKYLVVSEYSVNQITDEMGNPCEELIFIREISRNEIDIDTFESLRNEIDNIKSRLDNLEG